MWPIPRPHLRDEVPRLLVDVSDREWHTELVVEIADCRHGRTGALEHLRKQILGGGLADRTGNADDLETSALARSTRYREIRPSATSGSTTTTHRAPLTGCLVSAAAAPAAVAATT